MSNRAQRRSSNSIKGQSKDQLLARAQAAEGTANMFRGLHEDQIRKDERTVMEAERMVQQAQAEQRATERTIEVMLYQLQADDVPYAVKKKNIDLFNEADEGGEHFVNVEQTDDGFDMTLIFEAYEPYETEDEDATGLSDESDGRTGTEEDPEDNESDGEGVVDGDTDEAE